MRRLGLGRVKSTSLDHRVTGVRSRKAILKALMGNGGFGDTLRKRPRDLSGGPIGLLGCKQTVEKQGQQQGAQEAAAEIHAREGGGRG